MQMRPMQMRPSSSDLILISAAVLAVVSAGFAVHFWISRGVCTDAVICATIALLLIVGAVLLVRRMASVSHDREFSGGPVLLVMRSGPKRVKQEPREIKGKMPEDLHH